MTLLFSRTFLLRYAISSPGDRIFFKAIHMDALHRAVVRGAAQRTSSDPTSDVRRRFCAGKRQPRRRLAMELLEARMCLTLDVPAFSSLPGANHTIYLDFNGHVTTGTTWNSGYYKTATITSPAWSLDGDRLNFSDAELATIQRVWQRVVEDFKPFEVNVTTVEPAINDLRKGEVSGDTKWGVRAVVTIETTTTRCGCGGIAYIGSFNDLVDEPVFVYNASESGVAEAISHEVGHSLYLAHDGTRGADGIAGNADDVEYYAGHGSGATSWAPIMGNSYNRNVTTWDRGEYYNTNNGTSSANYSNGPDDLAVITTRNGFGYLTDDFGGTLATASPLNVEGVTGTASGIITTRTDVDMFSFTTGAGPVIINVNPAALRPNLDIQAEVLDSAGNVIATSNPLDALNASLSLTLDAGTYYLRIDGVGVGNPSSATPTGYTDYDSIGQYSVSATLVDPGNLPTLSVSDVTVSETDGTATFTVRLNGVVTEDVTVDFAIADGTATAGADFTTTPPRTLTFIVGEPATQTIVVPIANDAVSEPTETFNVILSNASASALITDSIGVGSITNDDALLTIGDTSATEANVSKRGVVGYTTATFTVLLAHPVNRQVSFSYASTSTGYSASAGVDYQTASGSVEIAVGQTSINIPTTIIGDNLVDPSETFAVVITSLDPVADDTGVATIVDNDSGGGGGNGNGNGNGGGKPGPAEADYPGDFTIIDHVDRADYAHDEMPTHHHAGHSHHDEVLEFDSSDDEEFAPLGGNLFVTLDLLGTGLRTFELDATADDSLAMNYLGEPALESANDLVLRWGIDAEEEDSTLSSDRARKTRLKHSAEIADLAVSGAQLRGGEISE
jgi:hypothetical protein